MKKKLLLCCPMVMVALIATSCSIGKAYDTNYLINLIEETKKSESITISGTQAPTDVASAKIILDSYLVSEKKSNEYQSIKNEITHACLNFISTKGGDHLIKTASGTTESFYDLNPEDSLQSLYNDKKIIMQTKVTNFNFEWNDTTKYWTIKNCALILAVQFREDYEFTGTADKYNKGSTISYDFILQSMYLEYSCILITDAYAAIRKIDYIKTELGNACGMVEAQINGSHPPLKYIQEIIYKSDSNEMVNKYNIKK